MAAIQLIPSLAVLQSWITAYIFDIRHPYDVKLTAVILRDPLTSITWSYRGLRFRVHRGRVFF